MNANWLAWLLGAYVVGLFALAWCTRGRADSVEDFLVAGRRLPLWLAWASLFATWFGAGTLLSATDEIRVEGLRAAAMEPLGTGLCLVVAGLFYARRLWHLQILTLPDFYGRRFGLRAEIVSSIIMVPGYFGWIAAQFVALAGLLELFWGIPPGTGILLVAVVGTGYTLIGGMWSVTLTDAVQVVLLLAGLVLVFLAALIQLGGAAGPWAGWLQLMTDLPPDKRQLIPTGQATEFLGWLALLAVGMLGNLPGQDLAQRIFAARSATVAVRACLLAGALYVVFGMLPVLSGLAADLLGGDPEAPTLPLLVSLLLSPVTGAVFVLALVSAVLSTIDSAILAPGSVLANNLMRRAWPRTAPLRLSRMGILIVAVASLLLAWMGESAWSLLETAYAIGLVGLFVPLTLGLLTRRGGPKAAFAAMLTGTGSWLLHLALGWADFLNGWPGLVLLPQELVATALGWVAYEVLARFEPESAGSDALP